MHTSLNPTYHTHSESSAHTRKFIKAAKTEIHVCSLTKQFSMTAALDFENSDQVESREEMIGENAVRICEREKKPKLAGEALFLVEYEWMDKFRRAVFKNEPGPVRTKCLLTSHGELRPRLVFQFDYDIVSEETYMRLKAWYGVDGPDIRRCLDDSGRVEVYLRRLQFKLMHADQVVCKFDMDVSKAILVKEVLEDASTRAGWAVNHVRVQVEVGYAVFTIDTLNEDMMNSSIESARWGDTPTIVITHLAVPMIADRRASENTSAQVLNVGDGLGEGKRNGLCGLVNIGNSCYLNAVIQCLSHSPSFRAVFLGGVAKRCVNKSSKLGRGGDVVNQVYNLLGIIWSGKHRSVEPRLFKNKLDRWTNLFHGATQQDAHEMLSFLLDAIHEDTNRNHEDGSTGSVLQASFGGELQSQLQCQECKVQTKSATEPFRVLSLPLSAETALKVVVSRLNGSVSTVIVPAACAGGALVHHVSTATGLPNLCLARFKESADDFKSVELVTSATRLHKSWTYIASEVDHEDKFQAVPLVHLHEGRLASIPVIITIGEMETKRQVINRIKTRFGDGFQLMYCMRHHSIGKDNSFMAVGEDDSLFRPTFLVQAILILEWSTQPRLASSSTIAKESVTSIKDVVLNFLAPEELHGWNCQACKRSTRATKCVKFETLPEILVLHLKRFTATGDKVHNPVQATLSLGLESEEYRLYGIIHHHGSTALGGHYTAHIQSSVDGKWYHFDDSKVSLIHPVALGSFLLPGIPPLQDPSAYLLFYRKVVL